MSNLSVVIVTAPPFVPGADASASLNRIDGREALLRSVDDYLAGARYPLSLLHTDLGSGLAF